MIRVHPCSSVAVFLALLTTACTHTPTASVRIDPALATLVPAETTLLVGTQLEKLRQTPLYKERFEKVPMPGLDKFAADTGLDPRKDVWELLFASNGKDNGVLMVRGKFSPTDMEPRLEREGATRTQYKNYSLFGDGKTAIFFMNMSTALAGSTPLLKQIIDNRDRGAAGVPALLLPLVQQVPSNAQFWAVFNGISVDLPFDQNSNLGNFNNLVRSLESGWLSADLSRGLDLRASGNCQTEAGAKQINDALRGIIGFGRLNTPDDKPELLKAFDAIKVQHQQRQVSLNADVPQQTVDNVLDMFMGVRSRKK